MTQEQKTYIIQLVMPEYIKACGAIFAKELIKIKGDDEAKKNLEAMEFMKKMMNGKIGGDPTEAEEWKKASMLAGIINELHYE